MRARKARHGDVADFDDLHGQDQSFLAKEASKRIRLGGERSDSRLSRPRLRAERIASLCETGLPAAVAPDLSSPQDRLFFM